MAPENREVLFEHADDVKAAIESSLDAIDGEGSFAANGVVDAVNPGLEIEGLGRFGIPFSSPEISRIINNSRQAPFGKGSDTIIDTSVRNTWEIDASRIRLTHPKWQEQQDRILQDVCGQLGIPRGSYHVQAELYKLLVYQEGAMFKPHKDTEKTPGMFGTMVICLPSQHTGGEVLLTFNGKTEKISTAVTSEWSSSYGAWYGDVLHEVKPILSGYRVVLTYNLVHNGPFAVSAPSNACGDLRSNLVEWKKSIHENDEIPKHLIYLLEHEYTEQSLTLAQLKGKDLNRVQSLANLLEDTGFSCYLAGLQKKVYGGCDEDDYGSDHHSILDICEESITLERIVELDGKEVLKSIEINEVDIVQDEPFDIEPDEEDYGGYTGNEGADVTHWYRASALVVLPRESFVDFKLKPFIEASKMAFQSGSSSTSPRELREVVLADIFRFQGDQENEQKRQHISRLCKLVIKENQKALLRLQKHRLQGGYPHMAPSIPFSDELVGFIAGVCLQLKQAHDFEAAASATKDGLPLEMLKTCSELFCPFDFDQLRNAFDAVIDKRSDFGTQLLAICALSDSYHPRSPEDVDRFKKWKTAKFSDLLSSSPALKKNAAGPLVTLACECEVEGWLDQIMVPMVVKFDSNTLFNLAFCASLVEAVENAKLNEDTAIAAYRKMAPSIISGFNLPPPPKRAPPQTFIPGPQNVPSAPSDDDVVNKEELVAFHRFMVKSGMHVDADDLLLKIAAWSATVDLCYFDLTLLPFLRDSVQLMKERCVGLDDAVHRQVLTKVLRQYLARFVQAEPLKPTDWVQKSKGCGCNDCRTLDQFLLDPGAQVHRFSMAERRRRHLESQLTSYSLRNIPQDLTTTTERKGTPYTLFVTKTRKSYEEARAAWQSRLNKAKGLIASIAPPTELRLLLDDAYDELANPSGATLPVTVRAADEDQGYYSTSAGPLAQISNPPGISMPPFTPRDVFGYGSFRNEVTKRKTGPSGEEDVPPAKSTKIEVVDLCNSP